MGLLFQQFGVTVRTAKATAAVLQDFFGDCIVGRGVRPPRSPEFRPPELFLWSFLEKEPTAITQEASRNLNIEMSRLLPALTKKLFEGLQKTRWKG